MAAGREGFPCGGGDAFGIQRFWAISMIVSRARFAFLVLVGIGTVAPFLVYSIVPSLMEIVVVPYSFSYWLFAYLWRDEVRVSPGRERLLKVVLLCSGAFLIGILLDLAEGWREREGTSRGLRRSQVRAPAGRPGAGGGAGGTQGLVRAGGAIVQPPRG
jgi:hypothetical protein